MSDQSTQAPKADALPQGTIRTKTAVRVVILVAVGELLAFGALLAVLRGGDAKPSSQGAPASSVSAATSASAATIASAAPIASAPAPASSGHAWSDGEKGIVDKYMSSHDVKKLQIGAGDVNLPDWLNTDIEVHAGQVYLDAAAHYPFADNTFHYVFAEQLIEHLTFDQGQVFLKESLRVLEPGGRIRLATPNLLSIIHLFDPKKTPMQQKLMDFQVTQNHLSRIPDEETANLNLFVRAWGHQFLYDPKSLHAALTAAGFKDLKDVKLDKSDDPQLKDLETHWKMVGGAEIDEATSQYVEATKP
jgi:predicted SAM-dependent methyltransferase